MKQEKLKIIELIPIREYKKILKIAKEGYKCHREIMDEYVYIEWWTYE